MTRTNEKLVFFYKVHGAAQVRADGGEGIDGLFIAADQPGSADHVVGMQGPGVAADFVNDHLLRHALNQLVQPSYRLELPGSRRPPTGINQEGERRQPDNRGEQSSKPMSDPFQKGATLHETVLNCENLKLSSWDCDSLSTKSHC